MAEMADTHRGTKDAPAARLGSELRDARLRLGWELPQLSNSLRIRQSYLEAIEAGRVAELPGTTYALGFVRAYAAALGMPGEDIARRFRAEAEEVHAKPTLTFPAPVPQRGVPAGAVILLGLVILAGAYGGWYWITEHRSTPVETVPPIPDRLAAEAPAKTAPSPQVATLLPSTAPPAPAPSAPAAPSPVIQKPSPPSPAPPASATTASATTASGITASGITASGITAAPPPPPLSPTQVTAPAGTRIVIKATADAWVTVKQKGGPPLLNKIMHAGDAWPVPGDKPGLTVTTGNAGGTEMDVDGTPIPVALGTSGMVRRDLPLDPDMLKAGHLPSALHAHGKPVEPPG